MKEQKHSLLKKLVVFCVCLVIIIFIFAITYNKSPVASVIFSLLGALFISLLGNSITDILNEAEKFPFGTRPNIRLLASLSHELSLFKGRARYDYEIDAKLKKHENSRFFYCEVVHRYSQKIDNNSDTLQFKINRKWKNEDLKIEEKDCESYFSYMHSMDFDEREIHPFLKGISSKDMYDITDLKVKLNASSDTWHPIGMNMNHVDDIHNTEEFIFTADPADIAKLPQSIKGKEVELQYKVKHIIEKTSFLYYNIEIPTRKFKLNFNYSDVKDQIRTCCINLLGSFKNPEMHPSEEGYKIERTDWVIPKSGFVIIWNEVKKHSQNNGCEEGGS